MKKNILSALMFSVLLLSNLSVLAVQTRKIPLEVDSFSGCYMERGVLKLHEQLPSQTDGKTITLEAENALALFFQEDVFARKAGDRADSLIQIKQKADEYTPQKDTQASGEKYIDYCSLGMYQFNLETAGEYAVWFRMWVPVKGQWNFTLDVNGDKTDIDLLEAIPAAKQWFWMRGPSVRLKKGNHQLRISQLLNGKRLDCIHLTLDRKAPPAGMPRNTTAIQNVEEGEIQFRSLSPIGLKKWQKLYYRNLAGGKVSFLTSADGGKNWRTLSTDSLAQIAASAEKPLLIRLRMTRKDGRAPELTGLCAAYEFDDSSFVLTGNRSQKLYFSRKNGALAGIVNRLTGKEYHPVGLSTFLFDLVLKKPGEKERIRLRHQDAVLRNIRSTGEKKTVFSWTFPKEKVAVMLTLDAGNDRQITWDFKVVNRNQVYDVIEVAAPKLAELRVSASADQDILVWPFSAGEFICAPATRGEHSVVYPDHAGLPYADLHNAEEGFYFGCHDPLAVATRLTCKANYSQEAVELSITRKHRIPAGSSLNCRFVTAAHRGDWHAGARIYREFFYSRYPLSSYRNWLRDSDAWVQGSSCGHTGLMKGYKSYRYFMNDFKYASFLAVPYIQAWGCTMNGACPNYYLPRLEYGGEKLFAEMMTIWRKNGGQIGHYFHGNSITPYYLLTEKYFRTPWSSYPAELRPPSYDWLIRNREYMDGYRKLDQKHLLRQTAKLNRIHEEGRVVYGCAEEGYTGRIPMSWRSNAFPEFLHHWVKYYIRNLNCSTAYLDTFAFRNDDADFNPYLGLNGEGDKPMVKIQFLNRMMKEMRAIEPEFSALTEGVADVFGPSLYFLISGFARNPNIYRYTLPDHIFFQGSCNGQWTKPLTRKNILQAFLTGNRYDLVVMFPSTYYMLRLRQRVSPFLNRAVFDDNVGIHSEIPGLEAYAHLMLESTEKIIPNGGTRAVTLTIANRSLKPGLIRYDLPENFKPERAFVCELYKRPRALQFTVNKAGQAEFKAPVSEAAAVILIEKTAPMHRWTAVLEQDSPGCFFAEVFNFSSQPVNCRLEAAGSVKQLPVAPGKMGMVEFRDQSGNEDFKITPVKISGAGHEFKSVISLGQSGMSVPVPGFSQSSFNPVKRRAASQKPGTVVLKLDFENGEYDSVKPFRGKGAFRLDGNGKYRQHKFPLSLIPDAEYRLTLAIRKGQNVSPVSHHNFVTVSNYSSENQLKVYARAALSIPRDNEWHTVSVDFRTGKELHRCALYLYNRDSRDAVWIDEVRLTRR